MSAEKIITDNIDLWTSALKKRSVTGRGSSKKIELYGIKKLRELILELAVRGKLVPQTLDEEPAYELLNQIEDEKAKLIKDKLIKKPKKLPELVEDDFPFDLPSGWAFVRLNDIGEWGAGSTPKRSTSEYYGGTIPWFKSGELNIDYISESEEHITELALKESSVRYNKVGDVLVAMYGATIGKTSILSVRATTNQAVCACTPFSQILNTYLLLVLKGYKSRLVGMGAGGAQPNISREKIIATVIALPPRNEQQRIVTKVDELMALCDQLESQTENSIEAHNTLVEVLLKTLADAKDTDELNQSWQRISEHFHTLFTTEDSIDLLKQTILQLSVMGKLIPQEPRDEPASLLLEKVATEKDRLLRDKKIKKEKALPAFDKSNVPFELPHGWSWCRLEDVVDIQSGITKGRKLKDRETVNIPYLSVANVQRSYLDLLNVKEIDIPKDELDKYKVQNGDLLITEGGDWDKVGRTAIWRDEMPYVGHQNHVFKARCFIIEQNEVWLEKFLNSSFCRDYFAGSSKQTTNLASINKTQLRGCLVAVPPTNEQLRILTKLESLFVVCEQLLEKIKRSQKTQLLLADATVEKAL